MTTTAGPNWDAKVRWAVGFAETVAGVCLTAFAVVVCLGMGGLGVIANAWAGERTIVPAEYRLAWSLAWLVLTVFGVRSLAFLGRSVEGATTPVPLSVARRRLAVPAVLRPVVGLWWVALAAASVGSAHYAAEYIRSLVDNPDEVRYRLLVPIAFLFGGAVAANMNLLVAAAALTGRAGFIRNVYRFRLPIDLAITLVLFRLRLPHINPFDSRRRW